MHAFINFLSVVFILWSVTLGISSAYYASGIRENWGNDSANLVASLQYQIAATGLAFASVAAVYFNGTVFTGEDTVTFFTPFSAFVVIGATVFTVLSILNANTSKRSSGITTRLYITSISIYTVSIIAMYVLLAFFWSSILHLA